MFYEGSLQEAISTALQQSKQVVCFVTDEGSESQQWEDEFLLDPSLKHCLESQSVVLRLLAGSQEAGFLEQVFPVPKKPTVVVIQNGQLKEYIATGTTKQEFIRRLAGTVTPAASGSQPSPAPVTTTHVVATQPSPVPVTSTPAVAAQEIQQPASSESNENLYDDVQSTTTPASTSTRNHRTQQSTVEEAKRKAAETKAKLRAEAEEKARQKADERSDSGPANAEQEYANAVKHRKQQANEERKRILQRIEDDKRARKEREAEERRARQLLNTNTNEDTATDSVPLAQRLPKAGQGDHCNLQVRLLDGSTIRTRFASDKTLSQDVRKWIDEERTDGDAPYALRVVLTPLPNKLIEREEESKSLVELGLAPSSTLLLVPTQYSVAYANAGGVFLSPVLGLFSTLYNVILSSVGGVFTWFFRSGDVAHEEIPMQNLRRRDAQLYNGNSLNFEPRNEDEDDDVGNSR